MGPKEDMWEPPLGEKQGCPQTQAVLAFLFNHVINHVMKENNKIMERYVLPHCCGFPESFQHPVQVQWKECQLWN